MQSRRRIILLVEATSAYGRGCLRGVARYATGDGGWLFLHRPRLVLDPSHLEPLRAWKADGIITRIEDAETAAIVDRLGIPTVDLRGAIRMPRLVGVYTDDRQVIAMATEHLLSNGLSHLAYCGRPGVDYSEARAAAFDNLEVPDRVHKHVFRGSSRTPKTAWNPSSLNPDESDRIGLVQWLKALPKPVGVVACNDVRGREVLELCAEAGLAVPSEVSVVGVDDDDVICQLSFPTMSSVEPNVEMIGYHAAAILDDMIAGKPPSRAPLLVSPLCVEVRTSSDATVLKDPVVLQAIRLIKSKIGEGINVKQLVAELSISRSTLERRFHEEMHCSPHDFIGRCRVNRAKQLLSTTNYSLFHVARMAGFSNTGYMSAVFRVHAAKTPTQYRQENA